MNAKGVLFNSITVNLPKNIVQLLFGSAVFCAVFGFAGINWTGLLLAIAGLSLAYSSVYMYNDIIDREEDAKDPDKRAWKLIANGSLSADGAMSAYVVLVILGLLASFTVSWIFGAMVSALLFLNFLHSSPGIRLKKRRLPTLANITIIEFIKYSLGWFALTSEAASLPVMFILMFAVIYTAGYMAYKFGFHGGKIRDSKIMFSLLGVVVLMLFMGSFFYYGFPLVMVAMMILSAAVFALKYAFWRNRKSFSDMLLVEFIILPILIASFIMLVVPEFAAANAALVAALGSLTG